MADSLVLKEFREVYNPSGTLNQIELKVLDSNDEIHKISLLETSHWPDNLQHEIPYETHNDGIAQEIESVKEFGRKQIQRRREFLIDE